MTVSLEQAGRELSRSVEKEMDGRGGYMIRKGSGDHEGKIVVGLSDIDCASIFPTEFKGFTIVCCTFKEVDGLSLERG